ncbi:hypothetical protein ACFLVK_01535 [Chloroflexota bacterium]
MKRGHRMQDQLREIAEKLAKIRLKGYRRVFASEVEKQRHYERQLIAYDADVEEYILQDFEESGKKDPNYEMSLIVKGFRLSKSELTEEEHEEWKRQMMVFDEVFDIQYNRLFGESTKGR